MNDESMDVDEISAIAEEAYIFAFPMLMGFRFGSAMAESHI
jgi:hypothetical protein